MDTNLPLQAASAAALVDRMRVMPHERNARPLSPAALAAVSDQRCRLFADRAGRGGARHRTRADRGGRVCDLRDLLVARSRAFGPLCPRDVRHLAAFRVRVPVADIYQVQAFRGHEKQYMRLASAWSVVFLIVIGASFFAKAGEQFSRVWLGSFYAFGLLSLVVFRKLLFNIWCGAGPSKAASRGAP